MKNMGIKYNYHTHTYRCKHSQAKDEEMVLAAIQMGMKEIGFSDHMPWPLVEHECQRVRMDVTEMEEYIQSIQALKEKYKDQITIYLGFEAEYYENRKDWLPYVKEHYPVDYFIFGNHFHDYEEWDNYMGTFSDQKNLCKYYYDDSEKALRSGMYLYFAHPDLYLREAELNEEQMATARKLCLLCKELDIPMEYNLLGRKIREKKPDYYPRDEFWKIAAEVGVKVIIGGDFHEVDQILNEEYYDETYRFLTSLGLEILDQIEVK